MNKQTVIDQTAAANENLTRLDAGFILAIRTTAGKVHLQALSEKVINARREAGQIVLFNATAAEASRYLMGFNSCLAHLQIYNPNSKLITAYHEHPKK